jgi:hypothetical protein
MAEDVIDKVIEGMGRTLFLFILLKQHVLSLCACMLKPKNNIARVIDTPEFQARNLHKCATKVVQILSVLFHFFFSLPDQLLTLCIASISQFETQHMKLLGAHGAISLAIKCYS